MYLPLKFSSVYMKRWISIEVFEKKNDSQGIFSFYQWIIIEAR